MVKIWEKQKYGKDMGKNMVKIWEKQKYSKALNFIILPFFFLNMFQRTLVLPWNAPELNLVHSPSPMHSKAN